MTEPAEKLTWGQIDEVLDGSDRTLLYGPPGTGKTYGGFRVGTRKKTDVLSVTLHSDYTAQELVGHYIPKGSEFIFHLGPALKAWITPAVLVVNEINEASGPVLTALYSILDDKEIARLTIPSGETYSPKAGFRVIATMNGTPDELPLALRDRFDSKIYVSHPHPNALDKLPETYRAFIKNIYDSGKCDITYRQMLSFINLAKQIGQITALKAVFGDRYVEVATALGISTKKK